MRSRIHLKREVAAGSAAPGGRALRLSRYGPKPRRFNAAALVLALLLLPTAAAAEPARLLLLGDSLVAGYGLPPEQGFAAKLGRALRADGYEVEILNAGVSGDTTAGGKARIAWALADRPTHALVELGANDALRGLDPARAAANLDAVLTALKQAGVAVLLAGMYAPPNLGADYGEAFRAIYPGLARRHGVAFYPFFLDGVAADPALNQADGIHPNAAGVDAIVARILPHVKRLLDGTA